MRLVSRLAWSKRKLTVAVLYLVDSGCKRRQLSHDPLPSKTYERYSSIQKFCANAKYRGNFVSDTKEQLGLDVYISEKTSRVNGKLLWCWVVERTLSWLNHFRRLSKDYGISISSAESMVIISHFQTLLKRYEHRF